MNTTSKFTERVKALLKHRSAIDAVMIGYGVVLLFCVPILYLMDFADMVPLALLTGMVAFFFAFFPFRKNETRSEESVEQFTRSPKAWGKKRVLLITIAVVVSLFIWNAYKDREQNELACLPQIEYRGSSSSGYYRVVDDGGYRKFRTQDEAMNYCMKVLS